MQAAARIAGATRALQAHLLQAYAAPDWEGPAPGLVDAMGAEPGTIGDADRLLVHLYAITDDAAARNAVAPRPGAQRVGAPPLALELRYLVAARASTELRAQALLERAWWRLHSAPAIPAPAPSSDPVLALAHGFSVEEALALFRALERPLQPAFGCRIRVRVEPQDTDAAPEP